MKKLKMICMVFIALSLLGCGNESTSNPELMPQTALPSESPSQSLDTFSTPATPSPTPATPSPTPATPSPTPATPSPTPATPSPTPATPSPTPVTPSPTPATPSPTPATPSPSADTPEKTALEYGAHPSNISNGGFAATDGSYIYFALTSTEIHDFAEGNLYKIKTDGTERVKLHDDSPIYINVAKDWIYYSNMSDFSSWGGGKIYKIKTDGTERTKLSEVDSAYINVVGDWIYYVQIVYEDQSIYKMRLDGSENTRLNNEMSTHMNVIDDWIYYLSWEINPKTQLYQRQIKKMKTDGSQNTLVTKEYVNFMCTDGSTLLFSNGEDDNCLYRLTIGDGSKEKLTDKGIKFINLWKDQIYLIYDNYYKGKIYRMNLDGTNKTLIRDNWSYSINIVGDWIYFYNSPGEGLEARKMKLDGTELSPH